MVVGRTSRLLLSLLLSGAGATLHAQTGSEVSSASDALGSRQIASPSLPDQHWALPVLIRWEALGLLPVEYLPPIRSVPRTVAAAALREAAARAPALSADLSLVAAAAVARFEEEFPETSERSLRVPLRLAAGLAHRSEIAAHDSASPDTPSELTPVDETETFGFAAPTWYPTARLSFGVTPALGSSGIRLDEWAVTGTWRLVELSIGREPIGYGFAEDRGVALSGPTRHDRVQVQSIRAVRLPGPLRHLGPTSFSGFLTRLTDDRHVGKPYFWGTTASIRPHPRVTLGVQRVIMFSGGDEPVALTAERVGRMIVGIANDGFDNQIASASFRFRLPTEHVLPATLYGEWGAEDAAGAWRDSPGVVAGLLLPTAWGKSGPTVGVEHAFFGNICRDCRRVQDPVRWYAHFTHRGGWVAGGRAMGHPLGGNGSESRLYVRSDLPSLRSHINADVFARERTPLNLYAPRWIGESRGGSIRWDWRFSRRAALLADWTSEHGDAWRVNALRTSVSMNF